MQNLSDIISAFETAKSEYPSDKAIRIVLAGLNDYPDNNELLNILLDCFSDAHIQKKFGNDFIFDIRNLRKRAPKESSIKLCLLEADLRLLHQDAQTTFETLVSGLYSNPANEELLHRIEQLMKEPSEAPTCGDALEVMAEKVATANFPRDIFNYLLVICSMAEYPDEFNLAKKIAGVE